MSRHVLMIAGILVPLFQTFAASAKVATQEQIQLSAALGYGLYVGEQANQIPSPYGLGLGSRAGYTFQLPFYVGAEQNYFFGASQRFPQYGDVQGALQIAHYGMEVGFDIAWTDSFVIRPKLGIGWASVTLTVTVEGITDHVSETGRVLTAGLAALYTHHWLFFVVDTRYTSLNIDTHELASVPGLNVGDQARLDGLLFSGGVGILF